MSPLRPESANVEVMRRGFANFSRSDWDAALAEIHPDMRDGMLLRLRPFDTEEMAFAAAGVTRG